MSWIPPTPDEYRFVAPNETPFVAPSSRGRLPHLNKPSGTYFVTFRLLDAVGPTYSRQARETPEDLAWSSEPPLRAGSCVLERPEVAAIVENALLHFDRVRYWLLAWCVMPNHLHAVVAPFEGEMLPKILHSWKSFTASTVNAALGRSGRLWVRESFDHLVRSEEQLLRFVNYVEHNPVAAGLVNSREQWRWSSARLRAGDEPREST